MVWQDGVDEQFFNQYDSLEDAVSDCHDSSDPLGVEVYEATPVLLGRYKVQTKAVKIAKRDK